MRKKAIILFSAIALALTIFSCAKENLGPNITDLQSPVVVVSPFTKSVATVDFSANESIFFSATFAKQSDWTIHLHGTISGAKKVISAVSASIDKNNSLFNGQADEAISFQKELVEAMLTFKYSADTFKTSFVVSGIKNHDQYDVLITSFDTLRDNKKWPRDWATVSNFNATYPKPDGNNYLYMSGSAWSGSPYINYLSISPQYASKNFGNYFPVNPDANKVYFNIMVYGTGPSDTWLLVNISEDGVQARHLNIRPDWTGWKLISVPYISLLPDITTDPKPDKVTSVAFVFLTDEMPMTKKLLTLAFDHPCFTFSAPYQP